VNEGANDDYGDLHLAAASPCINTADPCLYIGVDYGDIDGQPRIMGFRADMGADEFVIPMITVTKPQGGETWVTSSTHDLAWANCMYEGNVDILLSIDDGNNWQSIEANVPDTGIYVWHLPGEVDSNLCMIAVVPSIPDPNVVCIESSLFTIHPDSPGPAVTSKWKTLGGDFERAGLSADFGPELGCVKWQFETDGPVSASITIGADDRIHIACEDGRLYTLDSNGVLSWSYEANSPLISSPSIGPDGTVYVGTKSGRLCAVDIDGNVRWTHDAEAFIYSSPAVSPDGNSIYVGSQDGKLYTLARDGSELWSFETWGFGELGGSIFASPAIGADGTVYIGGLRDPSLYALDPNDGSVKWARNFESDGQAFASPVVAADGTIYQTLLYDPNLYAVEPNTGSIMWSVQLADVPVGDVDGWSEPAIGPDGTIYVSLSDPCLRAVEPNGNIKWVTRLGMADGFTLTVGSDGFVYAAGNDGYLSVVDSNGQEKARFQSDGWLSRPVITADNTMIVSDVNNRIWAIGGEGCEEEVLALHRLEDLDGSRAINFIDFALFAIDWLACNAPLAPCSAAYWDETYFTGDIDRNLYVDFADLKVLADRWLSEY
jgi:outer membrane protein assembly factor BamB